jgi:hypothetical protein
MNLDRLAILVERLRKEAISEPHWIKETGVYEYPDHSPKVVALLKLARAVHGVNAINLLCSAGLFIDFGVIIRCVNDCAEEVYFLLEEFPKASANVDQFIKAFFESTIDGYLSSETPPVPRKKIRNAVARVLKCRHDEETRRIMENIYKTFCGYVHADYAHVMEVYNGATRAFNLGGVPSSQQRQIRMEHVELAAYSVLHAASFVAGTLGLKTLHHDIAQELQRT